MSKYRRQVLGREAEKIVKRGGVVSQCSADDELWARWTKHEDGLIYFEPVGGACRPLGPAGLDPSMLFYVEKEAPEEERVNTMREVFSKEAENIVRLGGVVCQFGENGNVCARWQRDPADGLMYYQLTGQSHRTVVDRFHNGAVFYVEKEAPESEGPSPGPLQFKTKAEAFAWLGANPGRKVVSKENFVFMYSDECGLTCVFTESMKEAEANKCAWSSASNSFKEYREAPFDDADLIARWETAASGANWGVREAYLRCAQELRDRKAELRYKRG
jgi:hypothetical protein